MLVYHSVFTRKNTESDSSSAPQEAVVSGQFEEGEICFCFIQL